MSNFMHNSGSARFNDLSLAQILSNWCVLKSTYQGIGNVCQSPLAYQFVVTREAHTLSYNYRVVGLPTIERFLSYDKDLSK